jgi:AraC family transcriptional regulator
VQTFQIRGTIVAWNRIPTDWIIIQIEAISLTPRWINDYTMFLRIEKISEKKLVGNQVKMCYANNKTFELWRSFMPRRKEIHSRITSDLISMQAFDKTFNFKDFTLETEFVKWAVAEVGDFNNLPEGMETYTLQGGLYAIFLHKGDSINFQETYQYIFDYWLPRSEYQLDNREHFEVLGEKYKLNDPASEEEIWIPIKLKSR